MSFLVEERLSSFLEEVLRAKVRLALGRGGCDPLLIVPAFGERLGLRLDRSPVGPASAGCSP